jgi:uncharacterized protein YndB with AHSA1/START domain
MGFAAEQFVARKPADVWRIATDWKIAEFWLGVSKLRMLDKGAKPRKGAKLIFDVRGRSHLTTITRWEPPHHLGLASTQGGITASYEYTFTATEEGTRMQLEAECSAQGGVWKLALPMVRWMMERTDRKQLAALARLVELTTS